MRTIGPVRYAICTKIAAHLGVLPENVIPQITDPLGRPFGDKPDQPVSGLYAVRLRYGGAVKDLRHPWIES